MKAINFIRKREAFFSLIAFWGLSLIFLPQISFSQQGSPPSASEKTIPRGKDTNPPKLLNVLISPETLDVTTRSVPLTVTLQMTDDISGVKEWQVIFTGPSGIKLLTISGNPGLATGSTLNGIFQGSSVLSQSSEAGVWYATSVIMTDNVGNTTNINMAETAFQPSFVLKSKTPALKAPIEVETLENPDKAVPKEEPAVPEKPSVEKQTPAQAPPVVPPVEHPDQPEKTFAEEESTEVKGPPIKLTLRQSIKTALAGNRPYLDRLDAIKQRQGLGQVGGDQLIQVAGGADLRIPIATTSGLAAAETQFQTQLSPTFSIIRSGNSVTTQRESYGLSLNKFFITGGALSLGPTLTSSKFENFSSALTASFTQPLLRGAWPFVVGETVTIAKSDLQKEELNAGCCEDTSRQGLIFNVISQYYGIKNQMELVEIAKKAVERATRLFKATQAKQNVELATQLDVSRAEVQLSTQQRALNQAEQDLGNKEETFKVLMGLDTKETIELIDEVVYQPSEETIKEEELPKFIDTAIKNRPDLRAQQLRVDDADRRLRISRNSLLPDLDTSFSYSYDNVGSLDDTRAGNKKIWQTGISLSYPLPLTQTKINIEQSVVALRREERSYVEKKENISRDVKNDLRNVVQLQEQISITRGEIESAEKKLKIANFRFDRGLASNFDIVDAENNLIQAKQNLTKSIVDYLTAKSQLKRDLGILSEF